MCISRGDLISIFESADNEVEMNNKIKAIYDGDMQFIANRMIDVKVQDVWSAFSEAYSVYKQNNKKSRYIENH